jgi:hypothetical protein
LEHIAVPRRAGPLRTSFLSHRLQIAIIGVGALLLCGSGLAYALISGDATDAGRGGALTVALSFAAFFRSSATPTEIIEAPGGHGECQFEELTYKERDMRLKAAISVLDDRHNTESICLAISTFVGTMFWGFGDLAASLLGASGI